MRPSLPILSPRFATPGSRFAALRCARRQRADSLPGFCRISSNSRSANDDILSLFMPYPKHPPLRVKGPTRLAQVRPLAKRRPVGGNPCRAERHPQDFHCVLVKGAIAQSPRAVIYFSDDGRRTQEVVFSRRRALRHRPHPGQEVPNVVGIAVRLPEFVFRHGLRN